MKVRVKEDFELVYHKTGKTFNIYPFKENNLRPYMLNKDDITYLQVLAKTQYRIKSTTFGEKVIDNLNKVIIVNYEDYPLPGFVTKNNIPVVNISPLGASLISDIIPADIYALYTYSVLLSYYIKYMPFPKEIEEQIGLFYTTIFISLFGKKSGLLSAYRHLIPNLRFIINLYVRKGILGDDINERFLKKLGSFLGVDYNKDLNLDYNFSSTIEFLKCIKDNNILSISDNSFSRVIINFGGVTSLPIFEDCSRLFSTLIAGSIYGNHVFSNYWKKRNRDIYEKMFYYGTNFLK